MLEYRDSGDLLGFILAHKELPTYHTPDMLGSFGTPQHLWGASDSDITRLRYVREKSTTHRDLKPDERLLG